MIDSIAPRTFLLNELLASEPLGQLLSQLRFGGSILEFYLTDVGRWGFAYRQYLNGRFNFSMRFDTEREALEAAAAVVAERIGEGWRREQPIQSASIAALPGDRGSFDVTDEEAKGPRFLA